MPLFFFLLSIIKTQVESKLTLTSGINGFDARGVIPTAYIFPKKDTFYTLAGSGIMYVGTVSSIEEFIDLVYSSAPEGEAKEEQEYIKSLFIPITKEEFYEGLK